MRVIKAGKHEVMVDNENYDRVQGLKLHAVVNRNGDASVRVYWDDNSTGKMRRHSISLPKVLLLTDAKMFDHIDRNGLNCQVANLRPCSYATNSYNRGKFASNKRRPTTSRYKGVSLYRASGKWMASIGHNYKNIHLGYFTIEEDAARAYDAKAHELFGEFAVLNFPSVTI